jgi:hypothetical protein
MTYATETESYLSENIKLKNIKQRFHCIQFVNIHDTHFKNI